MVWAIFFLGGSCLCFFFWGGEGRTKGTGQLRVGVAADVIHEVGDPPKTEGQCCWWMLFFFFPMWIKMWWYNFHPGILQFVYYMCVHFIEQTWSIRVLHYVQSFFLFLGWVPGIITSLPVTAPEATYFRWKHYSDLITGSRGVKFLRNGSFVPRRVCSKFKGSKMNQ